MGLLLTISKIYVPQFLKQRKLEMLFKATGDAFRVTSPSTKGLSYNDCLDLYARFTREQADKIIRRGNELEVKPRLFLNAYCIGQQIKAEFNIHTAEEVMQIGALIYNFLKIDFQGEPNGNIEIKRCLFSAYYSRNVCHMISSLDEGLLTGIAGGGNLSFSQRITEGKECCRAFLKTGRKLE